MEVRDGVPPTGLLQTVTQLDQASLIRAVLSTRQDLKAGDDWYVLSMRWWDLWKDFVFYDDAECAQNAEQEPEDEPLRRTSSGITQGGRPPEIDNSDLTVSPDTERLKRDLQELRDFVMLPEEAWDSLLKWYGGGPALRRKVITVGDSRETRVELYPYWFSVYKVDSGGIPLQDTRRDLNQSRSESVEAMLRNVALMEGLNLSPANSTDDFIRLWYRSSLDVDQTDTNALDGWEQLKSASSTLDELGVVDGAALLLEVPEKREAATHAKRDTIWPFWHRMRVEHKDKTYKDPRNTATQLEVGDKIDASAAQVARTGFYSGGTKLDDDWFAATVIEAEEDRILIQFHNRDKPPTKQVPLDTLIKFGSPLAREDVVVERCYEAHQVKWHPVIVKEQNLDGTYTVEVSNVLVQGCPHIWNAVHLANMRSRSELTEEGTEALTKVFNHYGSDGKIEPGPLRGMMSCATNEYVQEDHRSLKEFLAKPYGDGACISIEGFMEYWRFQLAASGSYCWVKDQLGRLFARVKVHGKQTEEEALLMEGKEWMLRSSPRLSQYRSKSEPGWKGNREFRDFRRFDDVDVDFDGVWKQGRVHEVDWEEMAILVQTREIFAMRSTNFVSQKEWIPMESERLAVHETKSLGPTEPEEPGFLLARSVSRGGACEKVGACGLQNLGNTCFMNATLQCLSNTAALRLFFAGGPEDLPAFENEISTSKLSMEGKLAREFSRVMRMMWSNSNKTVAPAQLKALIAKKRPEFGGYQQQDAHELLSFLLDGLHEDVNRARPDAIEIANTEDNGNGDQPQQSDEVVADTAWKEHLRRNDSKIVDLFQFQMRSELKCPVCQNVSVTFDPIMYLSLPVPKPPFFVEVTVMPLDFPRSPMAVMNIEVPTNENFRALEAALWTQLGRAAADKSSCFSFADVFCDRIFKQFEKNSPLSSIKPNDKIWAIEVQLAVDCDEGAHTFVPVVFRKRTTSTAFGRVWDYEKCAPPRVVGVAKTATNLEVKACLTQMAASMLNWSSLREPWDLHIGTLSSWGLSGSVETIGDNSNVFIATESACVDFHDQIMARDMKVGLPAIANSMGVGGTTFYDCMDKNTELEQLSEFDSVYCRKCKEHRRQYKTLSLWTLPQVLVVHFKRFGRDRHDGPLVKIGCPIEFPGTADSLEELDLKKYMRGEGVDAKFELFGVVNHSGGVGGGHYTAHAMVTDHPADRGDRASGEWWDFNDAHVTKERRGAGALNKEAAYMLFYRRKSD